MAFLIPVSCLAAVLSFFCASGLQIHCTSTVPGGCDTAAVDFSNKPEMVLFSSLSGEPLPLKMDLDETVRDDNGEGDGDDDEDDDDEKEDENEDEKKDDKKGNGKGKWCKRELDCLKEGVAQQCSEDSGSYVNRTISWLSVLSTNTTGAAHGMWYSGIPTNPYRPLANQESPDGNGTSAYAHFSGTPLGNPLTTVMVRASSRLKQSSTARLDLTFPKRHFVCLSFLALTATSARAQPAAAERPLLLPPLSVHRRHQRQSCRHPATDRGRAERNLQGRHVHIQRIRAVQAREAEVHYVVDEQLD